MVGVNVSVGQDLITFTFADQCMMLVCHFLSVGFWGLQIKSFNVASDNFQF